MPKTAQSLVNELNRLLARLERVTNENVRALQEDVTSKELEPQKGASNTHEGILVDLDYAVDKANAILSAAQETHELLVGDRYEDEDEDYPMEYPI